MFKPVEIDPVCVAKSLTQLYGRVVTEVEAIVHLRREGFIPYGEGWLGSAQTIASLDHLLAGEAFQPHVNARELALTLAGQTADLRNVG